MANLIGDYVLDNGLNEIQSHCTRVFICYTDPIDYTTASSTYMLGTKFWAAGSAFGAPSFVTGPPAYEQIASTSIPDGSVTVSGSATKWAVADSTATFGGPRVHANGSLSAPTSVVAPTTFQLAPFVIKFPQQ